MTSNMTIEVSFDVDDTAAMICLKLVEGYINRTGAEIKAERRENGEYELSYEFV